MPFVTANGARLHYQELGEGLPLVMLHGLFVGSIASWYFTAAPALSRTHRVVMYDLRGHGLSEVTRSGYDVACQTTDLEVVVRQLGAPGPLNVVGHSFGAVIALAFAISHPDLVARLVLVEPPLPPSRFEEFDSFLKASPEEMMAALPDVIRRVIEEGRRPARRMVQKIIRLAQETTLLADLRAEQDFPDSALATVQCPTLAIFGSDSGLRPVGDRLLQAIPGAQLRILPGGHYLHLDSTAALTNTLSSFLHG